MKFDIKNLSKYTGSDLIFLVGAPGSRWSSIYLNLMQHSSINSSDCKDHRFWAMPLKWPEKKDIKIGNHRGAYWGPGNEYGKSFDQLNTLSKKELITEFMEPFDSWDGIKIIKSHCFSYHLNYLHNLFHDAKIICCYADDIDCFYWWHKCGGWGIPYPNYSWYIDDQNMLKQIKEENSLILKFVKSQSMDFVKQDLDWLCKELELGDCVIPNIKLKTEVAVCTEQPTSNFDHILP